MEITPSDLIERLCRLYGVDTLEALHGRLPRHVRSLERWKAKGWPASVQAALEMLDSVGYLKRARRPPPDQAAERARLDLATRIEEMADEVRRLES